MKALEFPLLADENINLNVISFLRRMELDVESIAEQGQFGLKDIEVLKQAADAGRVVLTHDSDFGGLALMGEIFMGIIEWRQIFFNCVDRVKNVPQVDGVILFHKLSAFLSKSDPANKD